MIDVIEDIHLPHGQTLPRLELPPSTSGVFSSPFLVCRNIYLFDRGSRALGLVNKWVPASP